MHGLYRIGESIPHKEPCRGSIAIGSYQLSPGPIEYKDDSGEWAYTLRRPHELVR